MGMNAIDMLNRWQIRRTFTDFADFEWFTTGGMWTSTLSASSTAAVADGVGGILTLNNVGGTLNQEAYVKQTTQLFKFVVNQPISVEALIQYTEASTNKAAIAFGLMSSVGLVSIADTTGEPKASYSGAVIYKVPNTTVWKTQSSLSTTQTTSVSTTPAGGAAYQRLRIDVNPVSATIAEVTYWVDGVQLRTTVAGVRGAPIKDQLTYTGALPMALFVCCKNGGAFAEILNVDYLAWAQLTRLFV